MTFKVLLFGSNGQLGSACRRHWANSDFELIALDRGGADFSDPRAVDNAVQKYRPDFVVNACAYTAVDKAESDAEAAFQVNGDSVGRLASACASMDIPVLHVSTDYVFDGRGTRPYLEDDAVDPQGVYGASKLEGEKRLQAGNPRHIILRTSWVFGEDGNNFVKTMLRLGREREELGVVADQTGCPTYTGELAEVILELVQCYRQEGDLPWGIYHCSSAGVCTWYDFALEIFAQGAAAGLLSKQPKVNRLTTAQYPTPASRPAYSVMDCSKLEALLGRHLSLWQMGLGKVIGYLAAGIDGSRRAPG